MLNALEWDGARFSDDGMDSGVRGRRPGWGLRGGLASQAFSSASNFLLVVSVARVESPAAFGGFAIAYSLFLLALGTVRGLVGETLSVRVQASTERADQAEARASLGAALLAGIIIGAASIAAGLLLLSGSVIGPPLVAFGVGMPVLLAQDAVRFIGFSRSKPGWAAASDGVWLFVQVLGTALLYLLVQPSASQLILLWSIAAACGWLFVAGVVGSPAPTQGLEWLRQNRKVGLPFASEFLLGPGSSHAMLYIVGGFAGVPAAGALRAAQTIFGPLNTLLLGVQSVALPEAAQTRAHEGRDSLGRFVLRLSGAFMACALIFGAVVILLPDSIGGALFGATWPAAVPLLLPLGLRLAAAAAARGYLLGLRAGRAINWSLGARAATGVATVIFALVGVVFGGALGAAYGLALAHALGLLLAFLAFRSRVEL